MSHQAPPQASNRAPVRKGAVVLGVSTDDVTSHVKFREKYTLNSPLLADTEKEVAAAYGRELGGRQMQRRRGRRGRGCWRSPSGWSSPRRPK